MAFSRAGQYPGGRYTTVTISIGGRQPASAGSARQPPHRPLHVEHPGPAAQGRGTSEQRGRAAEVPGRGRGGQRHGWSGSGSGALVGGRRARYTDIRGRTGRTDDAVKTDAVTRPQSGPPAVAAVLAGRGGAEGPTGRRGHG